MKVRDESRKILGLPELRVAVTCVRVPVVTVHSLTVHARFGARSRSTGLARSSTPRPAWSSATTLGGRVPHARGRGGTDPTWVGRVRRALDDPTALELFVCGDNLRKGAALKRLRSPSWWPRSSERRRTFGTPRPASE